MDRVGTGFPRRHENRLDIQVAPLGPRRADQTYLIGQPRGQRIAIRLAHRYRGNAQCLRGADDAHGDLAAIGHQQLVQSLVHGVSSGSAGDHRQHLSRLDGLAIFHVERLEYAGLPGLHFENCFITSISPITLPARPPARPPQGGASGLACDRRCRARGLHVMFGHDESSLFERCRKWQKSLSRGSPRRAALNAAP